MKDLEFLEHVIDQKSQMILDANDRIWEYAELAYHETRSADLLCQILKDEGFSVTTGDAGIPTCFTGTFSYGSGKPVMGILGEYDALSSLSQKAASPRKEPVEAGAPGHGCGHSALGTGSLAAVLAVKEYLVENKKDGTIIYFGCPAEEGAGSKQFMARAGMFDNVDFVYTWHPATINAVECNHSNAIMGANFEFKGVSSHAGGSPHLGRSALDAAELMNVGCNYLREHMTIPFENNIKCSNYVGETIDMAIDMGVKGILFVAHIGKFVKVAAGIMNTHSHCADGRMEVLCASAIRAGGPLECAREILKAGTTDEALEVLNRYGILRETMDIVMEKIQFYLDHRSYEQILLGAVVFSNVYGFLGQTRDAEKLIHKIQSE